MNVNDILSISRTGLNGLQNNLDIVANNVANSNTVGFKNRDTSFTDLLENSTTSQDVNVENGQQNKMGMTTGLATHQQSINFSQGSLRNTDSPYDLAISGKGFFGVRGSDGQLYLTRNGDFTRDANGNVVDQAGRKLDIQATIPENQWPQGTVSIGQTGQITIEQNGRSTQVGSIVLYQPTEPQDLQAVGNNLYRVQGGTLNSSLNGANGLGTIEQYHLENSTTDLADAMSNMILTQRAYSLNSRVLQSTDDMLGTINEFSN
ncbi:flagellar hook-basal body protein [Liquorilactobacillus nagelii]|uniref:Flagellar basal-body rod protein FlgG n=1 Tax=Liquorilactobacillus nagelii TaxID=82688 RepID=A0A0A7RHS9_9LACO|nr:flagellar hook-basal body protein [Liquorilactobacillus nagelii]AJA34144.1 flagellar basal-body rod protein FlgG [Liquorilactobacillus nagelii]KRL42086.1 flagellar basal-body rod protein [Liquorilactobacillus nagelii DSM 13675]QYH55060.1 flagellar hook-basal body protein [Liquorilactobacillus nagelii DSM 13675]